MESNQAGDLYHMLYEMEQESQSTCRNYDPKELKALKEMTDLLHQDQSHSEESTQP